MTDTATTFEPFYERIQRMKAERGFTWDTFLLAAKGEVSLETLRRVAKHPAVGKEARYPSARVLEIVARALEIPATDFPEYELAKFREMFDERIVGLEAAMTNLHEHRLSNRA